MVTTREKVVVEMTLIDRLSQKMGKVRNAMRGAKESLSGFNSVMGLSQSRWQMLHQASNMTTQEFDKFANSLSPDRLAQFNLQLGKQGQYYAKGTKGAMGAARAQEVFTREITDSGRKFGKETRDATQGAKGFKMEMLGIMFFGMMMKQTFSQLLQPVMEAYGVFDLIQATLLVLFVPIMNILFPILVRIMTWFMNLPEPVKEFIGWMAIFGVIIGGIIMVLGSLALGIGSLIGAFGALGPILPLLIPLLAAVATTLGLIFKSVSDGNETFSAFGNIVSGVVGKVKQNVMGLFGDTITGLIDTMKETLGPGAESVFSGFKNIVNGALTMLSGDWDKGWEQMSTGLGEVSEGMLQILIDLVIKFIEWLKTLPIIGDIIGIIEDILTIVYGVITGDWEKAQAAIDDIIHRIQKWTEWGRYIGERMINGIVGYVKEHFWGLIKGALFGNIVSPGGIGLAMGGLIGASSHENDFIWRPGQGAVSINPNDTLVGFKGNNPMASGNISINYNISGVADKNDIERMLREHDTKLLDNIRRNTA